MKIWMKLLIPKYSAFLGKPAKGGVTLWRYTVRNYDTDDSNISDETESWHGERFTCNDMAPSHSPINIDTNKIVQRKKYLPFSFNNYDKDTRMMLSNNGHLVTITFPDHNIYYTGGGVYEKYKLDHVHFHWGRTTAMGSEHTVDEISYPMEMHIVHYNMKYPDINMAKDKPIGLSVFAFMYKTSMENNEALTPIIDMLKEIKRPYTSVPLDLPSLDSIFPTNYESYYQYTEFVPSGRPSTTWTIFKEPIYIAETQLAEFRKLYSTDIDMNTGKAKFLGDNNRAVAKIPNLRVFVHDPRDGETSSEDEHVTPPSVKRRSAIYSFLFERGKRDSDVFSKRKSEVFSKRESEVFSKRESGFFSSLFRRKKK